MKKTLFIFSAALALVACNNKATQQESLMQYVDPMVGTGEYFDEHGEAQKSMMFDTDDEAPVSKKQSGINGHVHGAESQKIHGTAAKPRGEKGQCLPAVLVPNGMNFWTAQTGETEAKGKAPYYHMADKIQGFRNSHWIVGGATQDYGSATIMPMFGTLKCQPEERASELNHDLETSTPSYYSTPLFDGAIKAEMTGTSRTGIFRFTYKDAGRAYLVVTPNSDEAMGTVCVNAKTGEITGSNPVHRIYQGWGEEAGFSGYFSVTIQKPIAEYGVYQGDSIYTDKTAIGNLERLGAWIGFDVEAGEEVIVKMASSFCDVDGARNNQLAENPGWNFDAVRDNLTNIWEDRLNAIRVETSDVVAKQKFYTSMYHASFLPHAINDVDGRYPSFAGGKEIMTTAGTYYDDYSMWDTYRALHPLLSILYPEQTGDMIQSLIDKYEQGGWLPIFPCWNSYTSEMIGDHCASLIADAYLKGIRNFDVEKAYEALHKNAFETPESYEDYKDGKGRRALTSYLKYGFIPLEDPVAEAYHAAEQISRTLEYAYDDYALAKFAEALGHEEDAKELYRRSQFYRNVIDPRTGYVQGRHDDGRFIVRDNAFKGCRFITEGQPCHYTWYVPQDPQGLMECIGGEEMYIAKLDSMFSEHRYWHGNEPCHQVSFMYNYAGQPWKTQRQVRQIMNKQYNMGADGLAGNDDAGQMSAWYIFASLGFYPVCPANCEYIIASPSFDRAQIKVGAGKTFTVVAQNASAENIYIQSATLNGQPYEKSYIAHADIAAGGEMVFVMGPEPNTEWGHATECRPK